MAEHLAGSTNRILTCVCVLFLLCGMFVCDGSICYLQFCLIRFLTIGVNYNKHNILVKYFRYLESFLKI